mgnify:CR=1 FL=1
MRRLAFLAIWFAFLFAVVTTTHATPRGQEWVEHPARAERDAGASGDDDVPSKEGQSRQVEIPTGSLSLISQDKVHAPIPADGFRAFWGQCVRYVRHKFILVSRCG